MFGAAAAKPPALNPNNDIQISPPLADGISSLSFSPRANILVATSWDNNAYCWEITQAGQANARASTTHTAPILCSSWNADGSAIYLGGCDKAVKLWTLATNQSQQVAAHDAPIRHCAFIPDINLLVTGGWKSSVPAWPGMALTARQHLTAVCCSRIMSQHSQCLQCPRPGRLFNNRCCCCCCSRAGRSVCDCMV